MIDKGKAGYVSTHSRLKAAGDDYDQRISDTLRVSTHSRLKAAGLKGFLSCRASRSFNTQPPEGGWVAPFFKFLAPFLFQHTAA